MRLLFQVFFLPLFLCFFLPACRPSHVPEPTVEDFKQMPNSVSGEGEAAQQFI